MTLSECSHTSTLSVSPTPIVAEVSGVVEPDCVIIKSAFPAQLTHAAKRNRPANQTIRLLINPVLLSPQPLFLIYTRFIPSHILVETFGAQIQLACDQSSIFSLAFKAKQIMLNGSFPLLLDGVFGYA
jgi:hypothetical protein